jgi:hypothetical protein
MESGYEHRNAQGQPHFPEGGEEVTTSGKPARIIVGFMLAIAMIAIWIPGAAAQDGAGSITINAYACEGDDCTAPAVGVDFYASILKLDYSAEGVTDDAGIVVLPLPADVSPGYEIIVTSLPAVNVPAGGDIPFAFDCTKNGGEAVESRYSQVQTDPGGDVYMAAISIEAGDEIACNWYLFSADTGTETPPVAELPNTGSGVGFEQSSLNWTFALTFLALVGGLTAAYASIRAIRTRH